MTGLVGDGGLLIRAALALAAVLALLVAARWVMARPELAPAGAAHGRGRLHLVGSVAVDARTRILVLRHGAIELLLAVGPGGVVRLDRPGETEPVPAGEPAA